MAQLMQNSLSPYKFPAKTAVPSFSSIRGAAVPFQFKLNKLKKFNTQNLRLTALKKKKVYAVLEMDKSAVISEPEDATATDNLILSNNSVITPSSIEVDSVTELDLKENGFRSTRRTKLVCTVGPACCSFDQLEALAMGGMNVARLNMCHGTRDWHRDVIRNVRKLNLEKGYTVAIMMDTEGSEIHMGDLGGGAVSVKAEDGDVWTFSMRTLNGSLPPKTIHVNYEGFAEDVKVGDELVVDGGMARFEVIEKQGPDVKCQCIDPGLLLQRANLTFWRQGKVVRERNAMLPTISSKDWLDIDFGISEGVDFIAISFVKSAEVIKHLKSYIAARSCDGDIGVIAKIESVDSLTNLEDIIRTSDGAMVARGDLGAQIPLEQVPSVQQHVVQLCRQLNKPVIVASQLLESMIEYPVPTRAEIVGATLATAALKEIIANVSIKFFVSVPVGHQVASLLVESILTFILTIVIFATVTDPKRTILDHKMLAAKAYDLYNAEIGSSGLCIYTPETIWDVAKPDIPLWVRRMGGLAVVKVPYANAGQGVWTITNENELKEFMDMEHRYDRFIVQVMIGNNGWSSVSQHGRLYHVGTIPNLKGNIYAADLRLMIGSSSQGFFPVAIYARRASLPLAEKLGGGIHSWDMLGTNLSVKNPDGFWGTKTERLLLMDSRDFNRIGIGLDDLIEAYMQTVLAVMAIDGLACKLITPKGWFGLKLFQSLNPDPKLLAEMYPTQLNRPLVLLEGAKIFSNNGSIKENKKLAGAPCFTIFLFSCVLKLFLYVFTIF